MTSNDTKKKAKECSNHLKRKEMGPVPKFVARMGWFYKLKARYGYHNVKHSGEAKIAVEDAAASYPDCLRAIKEWGCRPQQVFNMDETGLQGEKKSLIHIHHEGEVCSGLQGISGPFHPSTGG